MTEIIYRNEHREFTISKKNDDEIRVTIHCKVGDRSPNIRRNGLHAELRLSFEELLDLQEKHGNARVSYDFKVQIGTTESMIQPLGEDRPSR